ncbi:uncharacterized protein [Epargyreus clarus]|uniref:uncharacterized protein n=1 Tax=Epargyreus clarus TaxID=520877 RepID=UPI003C2C0632
MQQVYKELQRYNIIIAALQEVRWPGQDDDIKDTFYADLELVYDQAPEYDIKIVLGDFNAKIGKEEIFFPTIGRHSKHDQSTDNGVRLISFGTSKSLVIKSTMFPHKEIHKGTWISPDGRTINQIDHVLVDARHKSVIEDVRTYRGADCDSDHYLLGIKIKAKIKITRSKRGNNEDLIDTEALKSENLRNEFQLELSNRFQNLDLEEDVNKAWKKIKDVTKSVALQVCGKRKRKKRRKWWTEECEKAVSLKRKYRILATQDNAWKERYLAAKRDARVQIRRAKREYLESIVKGMEVLIRENNCRKFYQEIRTARKGYQPTTQFLEDNEGNFIIEKEQRKKIWREYFQELLNCRSTDELVTIDIHEEENNEEVKPPDREDVKRAIMRLKNNKSPGADNIPGEIWKYGGDAIHEQLYSLILNIWHTEQQPDEWNVGVICPIQKKGCRKKYSGRLPVWFQKEP